MLTWISIWNEVAGSEERQQYIPVHKRELCPKDKRDKDIQLCTLATSAAAGEYDDEHSPANNFSYFFGKWLMKAHLP